MGTINSCHCICQTREAKEEKKRKKKLSKNRVEWVLPSVACLQSNFCVTHNFCFFPPSFFTLSPLPKRWQLVGGGTQREIEKKKWKKKERHVFTDMIPETIHPIPSLQQNSSIWNCPILLPLWIKRWWKWTHQRRGPQKWGKARRKKKKKEKNRFAKTRVANWKR